ncbi:hypothetical protein Golob_027982 [Gossypium lobatum]|uniref:Uncharacterized protein n=1 Tax=Gossypium lobatum TaxID=34289 RepID=A0A7J8NLX1_9ROSI|nr:hypothetical protein [Gossypium lobatum]
MKKNHHQQYLSYSMAFLQLVPLVRTQTFPTHQHQHLLFL